MLLTGLTSSLLCLALAPSALADYSLRHSYAGSNFFSGWDWYGGNDNLTDGTVYYVKQSESSDIAYINHAGNAIIKVDNTTHLANGAFRDSVRITSQSTYDIGSLVVFDALHLPFGCSTWPAMWMHARSWPSGGEVDVFEGVNLQQTNQVALHSVAGCYAPTASTSLVKDSTQGPTNCDYTVNANSGCTYSDTRNASYGAAFAAGGGGVFAVQLASEGISVWMFPRDQVPSDLSSDSPDPTTWGLPMANYPETSCSINQFFAPQQITLNIALCGSWAGEPGVFNPTCGTGTCADYVLNPSNFNDAYFELSSIQVFHDASLNTRSTGTSVAAASGIVGALGATQTATSGAGKTVQNAAKLAVSGVAGALAGMLM
ncbi:hypothetical protein JCM11641_000515 [Rhodosporidiobolus odoratus]